MSSQVRIVVAVVASVFSFVVRADASNLVINPVFNQGTYQCTETSNFACVYPPPSGAALNSDTLPVTWLLYPTDNVNQSNLQDVENDPSAFAGNPALGVASDNSFMSFMSTAQDFSLDCLVSTYFNITSGTPYTVSFWLNFAGTGTAGHFTAFLPEWNWALVGDIENFGPGGSPALDLSAIAGQGWQFFTMTEMVPIRDTGNVAKSIQGNVMFHGAIGGGTGALELANVSVTQEQTTPEPASLLLVVSVLITARFYYKSYSGGI